jgi:hypothetical protein
VTISEYGLVSESQQGQIYCYIVNSFLRSYTKPHRTPERRCTFRSRRTGINGETNLTGKKVDCPESVQIPEKNNGEDSELFIQELRAEVPEP